MLRILLLSLALLLSGCTALKPAKPEVSLAGIEVQQAGLFEQRFALKLRLTNPGETDVVINGLTFALEVNGQPFAKGVSDKGATVPRLGEAVLTVAATSDLGNLLRQVRELKNRNAESLDYRLHGTLSVPLLGALPFDRKGEVNLSGLTGAR